MRNAPTLHVVDSSFWKRCRGLHRLTAPHARSSDPDSHKDHSSLAVAARRARPPLHRCPAYAGAACKLLTRRKRTASTPSPRRASPRPAKKQRRRPQNTAAKSAMKTNAHNFIHACHMNTACVVIVLAKLIRALLSSRRRPPLCYPSSAFFVASVGCQSGGRATVGGAYV